MASRRQFVEQMGMGLPALLLAPELGPAADPDFPGIVVNDQEGEVIRMRDGTAMVRIKIAKTQGATSISFLSESFRPGDRLPVHKHANEDELIFLHKGSGLLTLGEKEHKITAGAVALVPRGQWHGLQNTGTENIEMRFGYTPAGFEGFFREVGTPDGLPFVQRSMEERIAIAKKWGMVYRDLK